MLSHAEHAHGHLGSRNRRAHLPQEPVALDALLAEVVDLYEDVAETKHVVVALDAAPPWT